MTKLHMWKEYEGPVEIIHNENDYFHQAICCNHCGRNIRDWKSYESDSKEIICSECYNKLTKQI